MSVRFHTSDNLDAGLGFICWERAVAHLAPQLRARQPNSPALEKINAGEFQAQRSG